ncbi:MAG: sulfite exporter TauE/SafE family protein [Betaproteobacteria bacterium]|nr:sulfite exporter TauE/SafE family protein [Betaproteobacteria bacterium]
MSEQHLFAVIATVLAGVVRTSVGVGSGIALTASLSLIFAPRLTLAIMAFLQIGLGASALFHYWRSWDAKLVRRLLFWLCLGVLAGTWLISVVPADWARRLLGIALASVALLEVFRHERPMAAALPGKVPAALSGFASGVAGSTANACGAVVAIYLKRHKMSHEVFLSTLAVVVMIHDAFRLGVFWQFDMLSAQALNVALLLLPFAFLGGWLGTRIKVFATERIMRNAVFGLVLIVGITLLR